MVLVDCAFYVALRTSVYHPHSGRERVIRVFLSAIYFYLLPHLFHLGDVIRGVDLQFLL